jgi:sulfite exporter TauE/SafE
MDLGIVFLTGLTIGGVTCSVMQGGLLASLIAAQVEEKSTALRVEIAAIVGAFLSAKLFVHVAAGGLLGYFGSSLAINDTAQTIIQLFVGVYLLLVALHLFNVHPIFRYVMPVIPHRFGRIMRIQSRSKHLMAPFFLGLLTILVPCGTTLAMEGLAVASGNPLQGALIMGVFTLGTMPLFLGIGLVSTWLGEKSKKAFVFIAGGLLLFLGLQSINASFIVWNTPLNSMVFQEIVQQVIDPSHASTEVTTQQPVIYVVPTGYNPSVVRVRRGEEVKITFIGKGVYSCASALRIPSLGVAKNLEPDEIYQYTFTPMKPGKIPFHCSMGMYQGYIEVL